MNQKYYSVIKQDYSLNEVPAQCQVLGDTYVQEPACMYEGTPWFAGSWFGSPVYTQQLINYLTAVIMRYMY